MQSISQALSASQAASRDEATSRIDSSDAPALPSTANWAAKNAHTEAARSSKQSSISQPSPVAAVSIPSQPPEPPIQPPAPPEQEATPAEPYIPPEPRERPKSPNLMELLEKKIATANFDWSLDESRFSERDLRVIYNYPALFASNGGLKRYRLLKQQEQERMKQEEERNVIGAMSTAEDDENLGSGSLQLGGEPDTQDEPADVTTRFTQSRNAIQPPLSSTSYAFSSGLQTPSTGNLSRALTSQQQEQMLRNQRAGSARQSPAPQTSFQSGYGQSSLHQHQTSNPFSTQIPGTFGSGQGHIRHASRFNFQEPGLASTVKPTANPQLSAQQAGVLPAAHGKQFQGQFQQSNTPSYSGALPPPPGLKSSGTPPISGGGMFGQGHGFASAMGGSAGFGGVGNKNEESMQQLLRSRDRGNGGQGPEYGKREFKFPFSQQHMNSDVSATNFLSSLYGSQIGTQGFQDHSLQKQKKKGKKHRHANTSSSGGGGIVDLTDPSIVQARMHHGGAGQSQFGQSGFSNGAMYGGYANRW